MRSTVDLNMHRNARRQNINQELVWATEERASYIEILWRHRMSTSPPSCILNRKYQPWIDLKPSGVRGGCTLSFLFTLHHKKIKHSLERRKSTNEYQNWSSVRTHTKDLQSKHFWPACDNYEREVIISLLQMGAHFSLRVWSVGIYYLPIYIQNYCQGQGFLQ